GNVLFASELIKMVYVAPEYIENTWQLYQKYKDKEFSFTDVSCFSIMKNLGISKAVSFDKEFVKVGIELF
ncbi:MAG: nucleic acid-binding protein, partial [Candidatus Omnitrophota bacterium]